MGKIWSSLRETSILEWRPLSRHRAAHVQNPLPDPSGRDSPATPPRTCHSDHLGAEPQALTETEAVGRLEGFQKVCLSQVAAVDVPGRWPTALCGRTLLLLQWGPLAESHWGPLIGYRREGSHGLTGFGAWAQPGGPAGNRCSVNNIRHLDLCASLGSDPQLSLRRGVRMERRMHQQR